MRSFKETRLQISIAAATLLLFSACTRTPLPSVPLDSSFGSSGIAVTDIGSGGSYARALVIDGSGKLVVAGRTWNGSNNNVALLRYNPNGTPGTTFGTAGVVITDISSSGDEAKALIRGAGDKPIVASYTINTAVGSDSDIVLIRYKTGGTPGTTFGTAIGSSRQYL